MLIKENTDRKADVIDGQQRRTTLTILFSILVDNLKDSDDKSSCMEILQEKGNKLVEIVMAVLHTMQSFLPLNMYCLRIRARTVNGLMYGLNQRIVNTG